MTNMAFGVRQVRDFLSNNGCVLTVRGYDYKTTLATVADLDSTKIKRKKVCEIKTIDDLDHFVPLSGFKTAAEWWVQIRRFCKGKMWLYRVQIDDSELDRIERDAEKIEQQRLKNIFNAADREFAEEHPMDIRGIDSDPALIDLQPHKDAAHADRIQREAQQAEQRRERMRERAGEQQGQIIRTVRTGA